MSVCLCVSVCVPVSLLVTPSVYLSTRLYICLSIQLPPSLAARHPSCLQSSYRASHLSALSDHRHSYVAPVQAEDNNGMKFYLFVVNICEVMHACEFVHEQASGMCECISIHRHA